MIVIEGKSLTDDEFHVVDLGDEPVCIKFLKQIEDLIISSPDGEILFGWDYGSPEEFTPTNAMLLKPHDNMKGLSKERITHLYMMAREAGTLRVYILAQK